MVKNLFLVVFFYFFFGSVKAHEGPPYPILVDQQVSESVVSVWTDPDVGDATFYFYIDNFVGNVENLKIYSPQLDKSYPVVEKQSFGFNQKVHVFEAHIPFPKRGLWDVRFEVGNWSHQMGVDVTPPGPTKYEFLLYFLPFLAVGFLWIKLIFKRASCKNQRKKVGHDCPV